MAEGLSRSVNQVVQRVPIWLVYALGLVPACADFYFAATDQLGANPVKTLERLLGLWALRFLIATLAITPLRQLAGINLIRYRRAIGLLAFYYAGFHLTAYLVLDQGLEWPVIWADIVKRPYITIGMAAFLILLPLAVTSNGASIRALGGKGWARLHKFVYVAVAGAAVHFILLVKSWPAEPMIYAAIVASLLAYRLAHAVLKRKQKQPGGRVAPIRTAAPR